jgi:hypothetical protein
VQQSEFRVQPRLVAVHGAVGFNVVDDLLGLAVGPAAVGFDIDVVAELLGLALEVDVSLAVGLDVGVALNKKLAQSATHL